MGNSGEKYAANLLSSEGYKIIQSNFRTRFGEVDLIAIKNNCLYFVEVKTRSSDRFGMPHEAVTPRKVETIKKVAQYYCLTQPLFAGKHAILIVSLIVQAGKVAKSRIIKLE